MSSRPIDLDPRSTSGESLAVLVAGRTAAEHEGKLPPEPLVKPEEVQVDLPQLSNDQQQRYDVLPAEMDVDEAPVLDAVFPLHLSVGLPLNGSEPPVAILPLIVPIAIPSEDPEVDVSLVDALRERHQLPQPQQQQQHLPQQPLPQREPTVSEIKAQVEREHAMEALVDPEPAVIAARERHHQLDQRIQEATKNPLERVGESIEKGRTAHAFEGLGESIAHGHIAGAAESLGRTLKDASVAVEHRMEEAAEKGIAAAEHLKDRAKALLAEPHLHRHEKGDYAHPPPFATEEQPLYETPAERTVRSEPVPPVPAWVHETHHVPKIEREYPTSSLAAANEVTPVKMFIIEPVVVESQPPTTANAPKISDEEIVRTCYAAELTLPPPPDAGLSLRPHL
jgi:hypothetical protein